MNEITEAPQNLPDTMRELARFVLVGREKINSVKAEIRAIEKLELAQEVREQKRAEAKMISEIVLDAEVRLGELFKQIPKSSGGDRGNQHTGGKSPNADTYGKSKEDTVNDLGFSKQTANRLETLAENRDLVEYVKAEARENGDFPTRTRVLDLAAYQKKQEAELDEYDSFIDLRVKVYKELSKIIDLIDGFDITDRRMDALRDNFDRNLTVNDHIEYINEAIHKLNIIKSKLWKGKRYETQ